MFVYTFQYMQLICYACLEAIKIGEIGVSCYFLVFYGISFIGTFDQNIVQPAVQSFDGAYPC